MPFVDFSDISSDVLCDASFVYCYISCHCSFPDVLDIKNHLFLSLVFKVRHGGQKHCFHELIYFKILGYFASLTSSFTLVQNIHLLVYFITVCLQISPKS